VILQALGLKDSSPISQQAVGQLEAIVYLRQLVIQDEIEVKWMSGLVSLYYLCINVNLIWH